MRQQITEPVGADLHNQHGNASPAEILLVREVPIDGEQHVEAGNSASPNNSPLLLPPKPASLDTKPEIVGR